MPQRAYLTSELPPLPGVIKQSCEDFRVDELVAYEPEGHGEHLFVHFEKTDLGTPEAVKRLATLLECDASGAGWAGLKDRRAVTTQWASFHKAVPPESAATLPGIRILQTAWHPHKLRTGHLRGNRFSIRIRELGPEHLPQMRSAREAVQRRGLPNYFGTQRFGRDHRNVERARRWLVEGGKPPRKRFERKLLVSVLQSVVFNQYLTTRIRDGLFDSVVPGDVLKKEQTGGLFLADDLQTCQQRMDRHEISPTGPVIGSKMFRAAEDAEALEERAMREVGVQWAHLTSLGKLAPGTRRPLRVSVRDVQLASDDEGIWVDFELPKGAYATVLLDELLKSANAPTPTGNMGHGL